MRLLHTSNLELESFIGKPIRPRYAILSHTWGKDEFVFEDAQNGIRQHVRNAKRGLRKILDACERARRDGLDYVWVDTCCIDKSSSAELSEAINSMFKWYKESATCYVFMEDVTLQEDGTMRNFDNSAWFTRGWTLQELIAPHGLVFFDRRWNYMFTRDQLASRLEKITGITRSILQRTHTFPPSRSTLPSRCVGCGHPDGVEEELREEPISRKMGWAANRVTTRPEDVSYCLLGLFDINMPLLYGEGENAFWRLQEEILKKYPDQSILTWTDRPQGQLHRPYLPQTPSAFQLAVMRPGHTLVERGDIIATARGLEIDVMFGPCVIHDKNSQTLRPQQFMAILSCAIAQDPLPRIAIVVEPLAPGAPDTAYTRVRNDTLILLNPKVEPLVLKRNHQNEIREVTNIKVDYDPEQLSLSRILLAAMRPIRDLSKQRPGVYIVTPGIEKVKMNVKQWTTADDAMILSAESSSSSRDKDAGTISIRGAWFLGNGNTGFFVIWGVPVSSSDQDFISWVETWGSFLEGPLFSTDPKSMSWATFEEALRRYLRRYQSRPPSRLATKFSEPGFKVWTKVRTVEFLGRTTYKVGVDIEGWKDRPVSILKCLQVLAHDWT
ncbi:hypothetical protein ACHAPT_006013 [Fusarium lateritium]